ncbi:unnamed protein product, partial [Symbiodinium sp. KB8]
MVQSKGTPKVAKAKAAKAKAKSLTVKTNEPSDHPQASASTQRSSAVEPGTSASGGARVGAVLPPEFQTLELCAGEGVLSRYTVAQCMARGIDVSDAKYSTVDLFGPSLTGAAYLEAVWKAFGEEECDVPWYTERGDGTKVRNVQRSPLSRPIQNSTASAYMHRILKEGLSQLASGEAVFRWKDGTRSFPAEAGTFNHRAEALYRAAESHGDNVFVKQALA